jgi:hypothetical protein
MSRTYIDRHSVDIKDNLYRALIQLRSTTAPRLLWVDALCIDQDNQEEVGGQVAQMGAIYAGASNVIVWFGEAFGIVVRPFLYWSTLRRISTTTRPFDRFSNHQPTGPHLILSVRYSEKVIGREFGSSKRYVSRERSRFIVGSIACAGPGSLNFKKSWLRGF